MKHSFTIYPYLNLSPTQRANPYVKDFVAAVNAQEEAYVLNPPHKNPLLSLLPLNRWGEVTVFNWFESIPDYKYGTLQAIIAVIYVCLLKICGRKVVWVFHNKKPHSEGKQKLKKFMAWFIAHQANLIVTHALEGVELVKERYPFAANKVKFMHHPTKNRLNSLIESKKTKDDKEHNKEKTKKPYAYDLLLWGPISRYKGVFDFVQYLREHPQHSLRVCIIGTCSSKEDADSLKKMLPANVNWIEARPSFHELGKYIRQAAFVLAPYFSESVLSSGILMDSLSMGARVIGPHTGSFKDYTQQPELKVYTFQHFDEIPVLFEQYKDIPISLDDYQRFLDSHNWNAFVKQLIQTLFV